MGWPSDQTASGLMTQSMISGLVEVILTDDMSSVFKAVLRSPWIRNGCGRVRFRTSVLASKLLCEAPLLVEVYSCSCPKVTVPPSLPEARVNPGGAAGPAELLPALALELELLLLLPQAVKT